MSTITTRAGKGSALTHNEADANFTNLNTDKLEAAAITNMLETTDIGVSVQAYDADTTKNDVANTFTANQTIQGNLIFDGTGRRITGDCSNSTHSNRLALQSSVTNGNTSLALIPNGTSQVAVIQCYSSSSDMANCSLSQVGIVGGDALRIQSNILGTGTYLPITFATSGFERARIDTSGNVLVTSAAGLGYGTGAGGTVTQATNKSTAVTLNKPCGQVTMNNAALAGGASVYFDINNSLVTAADCIGLTLSDTSALNYSISCLVSAGKFTLVLKNESGVSLSDAVIFNFYVAKVATS